MEYTIVTLELTKYKIQIKSVIEYNLNPIIIIVNNTEQDVNNGIKLVKRFMFDFKYSDILEEYRDK